VDNIKEFEEAIRREKDRVTFFFFSLWGKIV
jgi:hypothetical protein